MPFSGPRPAHVRLRPARPRPPRDPPAPLAGDAAPSTTDDLARFAADVRKFVRLFCFAQWKRERIAISFRVTAFDLDPKTGFRFPPVQAPFTEELAEMDRYVERAFRPEVVLGLGEASRFEERPGPMPGAGIPACPRLHGTVRNPQPPPSIPTGRSAGSKQRSIGLSIAINRENKPTPTSQTSTPSLIAEAAEPRSKSPGIEAEGSSRPRREGQEERRPLGPESRGAGRTLGDRRDPGDAEHQAEGDLGEPGCRPSGRGSSQSPAPKPAEAA